jgi:hypothetical protein
MAVSGERWSTPSKCIRSTHQHLSHQLKDPLFVLHPNVGSKARRSCFNLYSTDTPFGHYQQRAFIPQIWLID